MFSSALLEPSIALLPAGDTWEDFYSTIGVTFESFCNEFTGSWQFRVVEALKSVGVKTVTYYSSAQTANIQRCNHLPTSSTICLLPAPRVYRAIVRKMTHPHPYLGYWGTLEELFGPREGISRKFFAGLKQAAPYVAQSVSLLARQIKRDNCRAILCQDYEHAGFDRAILVGHLLGLPVFAIFQGGVRDWNAIGRRLRPITMRLCSGLIIGPVAEAERVRKEYGIDPSKVTQIFNPLSKDIWEDTNRRLAKKKLGLPAEAQIISWHGRIEIFKKGLDVLIESFVRLVQGRRHPNIHLAVLGAGPDSEEFMRKLEPVRSNVSWIDRFVSDRKFIRTFLSAGDVYAFPSRMEGLPVAPTEAMACGLPVVAARASGVHDIFIDGESSGGIIVPPGDVDAFAQGLGKLLGNTSLRQVLSEHARYRARAFSMEIVGPQLREVLLAERLNPDQC